MFLLVRLGRLGRVSSFSLDDITFQQKVLRSRLPQLGFLLLPLNIIITYFTFFLIQAHSTACEFALIKCVHPQCTIEFTRSRLGEHLKSECEYRNVKCDYCGSDVTFASIKVSKLRKDTV